MSDPKSSAFSSDIEKEDLGKNLSPSEGKETSFDCTDYDKEDSDRDSGGSDEEYYMDGSDDYVADDVSDDGDQALTDFFNVFSKSETATTHEQPAADSSLTKRKKFTVSTSSAKRRLYAWYCPKPLKGSYTVCTDGAIQYETKSGRKFLIKAGFGAIARDDNNDPVAASAKVSDKGPISIFYHQFEGVKLGIQLAITGGFRRTCLFCNSFYVQSLLIGKGSRKLYKGTDREDVMNIIAEIDELLNTLPRDSRIFMTFCRKGSNRAADYLSKRFKYAVITTGTSRAFGEEEWMKLVGDEFGMKLNVILRDDKYRKAFMYPK